MELRGRLLSLLLLLILIITVLLPSAGCDLSDVNAESGYVRYTSLRDIPGITDTDIFAVADLRAKYDRFIYAMPPSAEAFEDSLTGGINGFSAFFCDALSELFDIPFVLENHSLSDIVDGLDSGEIHFTGTLTPTDERKSQYHMTDPIVIRTLKYFRLDGSRSLSDIQLEGLPKFAFLERSTVFEAVSEALPPDSFEAVFISDTDEVYNLLKNKKIDAFIHENPTESIFESYPDIVATDFLPVIMSPVSFTAQKNEFKPIIDVIQKILLTDDMRFLLDIYNRGSLEYNKHKLNLRLTEAESEYIQDNGKVKVAAEHDNYPISFYNYHDKEFQGIIHDIIPEIEAITGLNFEIVNSHEDDWSGIFRMLENGDVSMITELIRLPDREEFLYADSAILTDYHALISKMEHRDINVNEIPHVNIGLVRDYAHTEVFNLWFPDHKKTRYYDSFEDAFEALSRDEIDMIMASENYLLMITNYREQPGYKINVAFDSSYKSTVGFHPNEDVLKSIVEKSLQIIDVKSHSDKWTKRTFDYRAKLEQARLIWLIAAVVIFMFAVILFNLNRAKNRLKKESKFKSQFLAAMSHEIRTPMNAIIGVTQIERHKEDLPEEYAHAFDRIHSSCNTLLGIINDILDLSKIESGKLRISPSQYDVASLINDTVQVNVARIENKPIHFILELSGELPSQMYGDEVRLKQILNNLLSNAFKFTDRGSVTLTVSHAFVEGDVRLRFKVADTGQGIKAEEREKLFTDYSRFHEPVYRTTEGAGLGLNIVKHLVDMMDGEVSVESEYNKGSTFYVDVAQEYVECENLGDDTARKLMDFTFMNKAEILASGRTLMPYGKVLVIDDVEANLFVAEGLLKPYELNIETGRSGYIALERVKKGSVYDIIFMDHMMPKLDGIETTKKLREMGYEGIIIALSANALAGNDEMFKKNGFDEFVPKPIDVKQLDGVLNEYIRDKHFPPPPPPPKSQNSIKSQKVKELKKKKGK